MNLPTTFTDSPLRHHADDHLAPLPADHQLPMQQPLAANDRHALDQQLLVALARGSEIRQVAQALDISESTIYRRLRDPKFRRRISQLRDRMTQAAVGRLAVASSAAVDTLVALLGDNDARVRHAAAKTILEQGIKQRELSELGERLATLEHQAKCLTVK